ncbi:MAG: L,D-transpeptidase [Legionellales bacterium]|nr:L,D-transpeptidase [Legionellales bacterium]|tara:strand:- start:637 stop:1140 length:504 start_codon:yes stop_codon:yes gene_type:complete
MFGFNANQTFYVEISINKQQMLVYKNKVLFKTYLISTAKNGVGEQYGSECTPRGIHQIRAKIGTNQPENTVFFRRRPNGEVYTPAYAQTQPQNRDWIITRILWLSGLEPDKNRFGSVDTARRKIYIHGTPDEKLLGKPGSRGCIRMGNRDIMEFFDFIPVRTIVDIQ